MNATYFEQPTDKLKHNGKDVGVINKGDTQTNVNEKLALEIEALKTQLNSSKPQIEVSAGSIVNSSNFGVSTLNTVNSQKIQISTIPNEDNVYVSYKFNIEDGIEKVRSNVSIEGVRAGSQTVLYESDKLINGFYLTPNNFPATLVLSLDQIKNNSLERITSRVALNPLGDDTKYPTYIRNINRSDLNTQKDVNEFLYGEVNRLNNIITNDKISYNGVEYAVQDLIVKMLKDIKALQNEIISLKKG
ncbi:MAG: hypothetical protein KBH21_00520 [Acetoanaerobium sp.]|nr:hypothetical protein [Acetoanaerobium sp.]